VTAKSVCESLAARDPQTPEEWREAVESAVIALDIAPFVNGVGMRIDRERCHEIIAEGERRGYKPPPHLTAREVAIWMMEWRSWFGE